MTITRTRTRTHVFVAFANPHLVCDLCHKPAPRWHNNTECGCTEESWLDPCSHNTEAVSVCPSWSPVDGCQCQEHLGRVDHPAALNGGEQQ